MARSAERTRERILTSAYGLLYREGFARVSLDAMLRAYGAPPSASESVGAAATASARIAQAPRDPAHGLDQHALELAVLAAPFPPAAQEVDLHEAQRVIETNMSMGW